MQKNPFLSAAFALLYILAVAFSMVYGSALFPHPNPALMLACFLSLFVFSILVMGYFFILTPFILALEGKRTEAIAFLLRAVGTFGGLGLLLVLLVSLYSL